MRILVIVLSLLLFGCQSENPYDLTLKSNEKTFKLSELETPYKLVYFGYASCPDICPTTLNTLKTALKELDSSKFSLVFISLDEERDDLENLALYGEYFGAIGTHVLDLDKAAKTYGVKYKKVDLGDSKFGYSIAHSSAVYVLDSNNNLVLTLTNLVYSEVLEKLKELE